MADAPAKKSDFVKTYVWGMGLIALVLAVAWFKVSGDRNAYAKANAEAPRIFGAGRPAGGPSVDQRPTTITGAATGILKYLQTYKEARVKPDEGKGISLQVVRDTATGVGMNLRTTPQETVNPFRAKGYEEVYANFTFEPTDLDRLATFLYNYEGKSTKLRTIDLKWDLRPEKENPLVPGVSFGHLIQAPQVKLGYRRPISSRG
jgi:hypothetical protein